MKIPVESQLAQALAANDKKRRDGGLKKMKAWLAARTSSEDANFSEDEIMKLWKGLFYCMWMSDKPLVQEELAENISQLIHSFGNSDASFLFMECFFKTMNREWSGLDQWRMDKYMMFTRTFLAQCFALVKKLKWSDDAIEKFSAILRRTAACPDGDDLSAGFQIHVADIYIEELAKAATDKVSGQKLVAFFEPYCYVLASCKIATLRKTTIDRVFKFAIRLSNPEDDDDDDDDEDIDIENDKELNANDNQEEYEESDDYGDDDDDDDHDGLDVEKKWKRIIGRHELKAQQLPFPKFDYKGIGDRLLEIVSKAKNATSTMLRQSHGQVKNLHEMAKGIFPLDSVPEIINDDSDKEKKEEIKVENAAKKLFKFEEKIRQEKLDYALSKRKRRKTKYTVPESSDEDDEEEGDEDNVEDNIEDNDVDNDEDEVKVVPEKPTKRKRKKNKRKGKKPEEEGVETVTTSNATEVPEVIKDKLLIRLMRKEADEKMEELKKRKFAEDETSIIPKNNKKLKESNREKALQAKKPIENSPAKKAKKKKKKKKVKVNGDAPAVVENRLNKNDGSSTLNDDSKPIGKSTGKQEKSNEISKRKGRYFNKSTFGIEDDESASAERTSKSPVAPVKTPLVSLKQFKKSPPAFFQKTVSKTFPKAGKKKSSKKGLDTSASRKVNFQLTKNGAQEVKDYALSVRSSPAIPFDSSKLPAQGVLKPGLTGTPVKNKAFPTRAKAMEFF